MNKFTVEYFANTDSFEVVKWISNTPGSFRGEIIFKSDNFDTANTVCDQHILDSDPAYLLWLEQQDSEFV
jgi:hypothetical protein